MASSQRVLERRVLVTGGAGFIGSHYLNMAVMRYPMYLFINIDALTYAGDSNNVLVSECANYTFEKCDVRDVRLLETVFEKHRPTHVIHFAAESHVDTSIQNPALFVETNVTGTHNLLLLATKYKVKRFLHISTDEVYGSLTPDAPLSTETDVLSPSSPYSASKAAAEQFVFAQHRTFSLNTVITRGSNTYGPRQNKEKLIPLFISKLLAGQRVPLYGDGHNIRNWIYVDDHIEGVDCVFHQGKNGEIYNLGGPKEYSNIEMTQRLLELLNEDESSIAHVADRLGHDFRYALDSEKAFSELNWRATTSLEDGLKKTINYYRKEIGV